MDEATKVSIKGKNYIEHMSIEFRANYLMFLDKFESDKLRTLSKTVSSQVKLKDIIQGYLNKFRLFEQSYKIRTQDYLETYEFKQVLVFNKKPRSIEILYSWHYGSPGTKIPLEDLPMFKQVLLNFVKNRKTKNSRFRIDNKAGLVFPELHLASGFMLKMHNLDRENHYLCFVYKRQIGKLHLYFSTFQLGFNQSMSSYTNYSIIL